MIVCISNTQDIIGGITATWDVLRFVVELVEAKQGQHCLVSTLNWKLES